MQEGAFRETTDFENVESNSDVDIDQSRISTWI